MEETPTTRPSNLLISNLMGTPRTSTCSKHNCQEEQKTLVGIKDQEISLTSQIPVVLTRISSLSMVASLILKSKQVYQLTSMPGRCGSGDYPGEWGRIYNDNFLYCCYQLYPPCCNLVVVFSYVLLNPIHDSLKGNTSNMQTIKQTNKQTKNSKQSSQYSKRYHKNKFISFLLLYSF